MLPKDVTIKATMPTIDDPIALIKLNIRNPVGCSFMSPEVLLELAEDLFCSADFITTFRRGIMKLDIAAKKADL